MALRSASQRRLLAMLAVNRGSVVSTERLCESLALSKGALRTAISRLRDSVGDQILLTVPPGYMITADPFDITLAERLIDKAGSEPSEDALKHLAEAIDLWRGPSLVEFADEEWAHIEAIRLDELRTRAEELRAQALLSLGEPAKAVGFLEPFVVAHPLRDRPQRLLIEALHSDGRTVEALRSYQAYRRYLADTTGAEPSAETQAVERAIAEGKTIEQWIERDAPLAKQPDTTILFTDVVNSTQLWEQDAALMSRSLRLHDEALRKIIETNGGEVFSNPGDSFGAAFARSTDAVVAAVECQQRLGAIDWVDGPPLTVRMGLHRGLAERRDGNFFGAPLNLCARVCAIADGGQILLTSAVDAGRQWQLIPCGHHQLKGVAEPTELFQIGSHQFANIKTNGSQLSNIPAISADLLGREAELRELQDLLSQTSMLTLIGVGGVGKTRLSYAFADLQHDLFADGVWVAELANTRDLVSVLSAIAEALRVPAPASATGLADSVRGSDYLLILDNCEHVAAAVADVCQALLASSPRVKILTNSRERIGVDGEWIYRVFPLRAKGSAEGLFIQRARAVDVNVDPSELELVAEICQRLDRLPLAIELAAGMTRLMSLHEIAQRLDARLDLLRSSGRPAGINRHETLRSAIDWSYEGLTQEQQTLFRWLSVFRGGFTLPAVEYLAVGLQTPVVQLLGDLVDHSLVMVETGRDQTRYALLETIREYARDQLTQEGELDELFERHACWCEVLAKFTAEEAFGPNESRYIERLVTESLNLRAAISRLLDSGQLTRAGDLVLLMEDFAYCASALAELVGPVMQHGAVDGHPQRRRLLSIELIRRSTSDTTAGRAELAQELADGLRPDDPGSMQIVVLLIANALHLAQDPDYLAAVAERARAEADPVERARLLTAALLGTFYADGLPKLQSSVVEAIDAAKQAGMKRLLIPAASMACLGGLAAGATRQATSLAKPILANLKELPEFSIMSSGLVTMYTEAAVQAELPLSEQLAAVKCLKPTLSGDFNRLGLALARLVECHCDVSIAVRAVGACAADSRSKFSWNQRETILASATERLGAEEVHRLVDEGSTAERSDLYREMWALLAPHMVADENR